MSTDLWHGALIDCAVWHRRSGDVARQFRYRLTYAALPLDLLEVGALPLRPDRPGLWHLRARDYGWRDGRSLADFARAQLDPLGLGACRVSLVTLPRSCGYGFNPVSFWLARDDQGLRAVLAEVSNTFGERHLYLCRHDDLRPIAAGDRLQGRKLFHVSPFLPRAGSYVFRFDPGPGRFGAWVDWLDDQGRPRLQSAMTGAARPLNRGNFWAAALRRPLQCQRVMALIHWHALRLAARGVPYRRKPAQLDTVQFQALTGERPHHV